MNITMIKILTITVTVVVFFSISPPLFSQIEGPHEIKWLRIGSLHSWFSNAGAEIEYGRRTRAHLEDQVDLLRWPAEFQFQDHCAAKAMWIGTTNYDDPVSGSTYPYKVVGIGTQKANLLHYFMPFEFKMIGRFHHPVVIVDGDIATDNYLEDITDEIDETIKADRLIINKLHSSIGITVTRTIMAFSQQNHDNYFIYEYVFKNTGIVDNKNSVIPKVLTDVYFHFQYRYAFGYEGFRRGWPLGSGVSWGRNTVNQVVGQDFRAADFEFRALYSWYGPHSASPGYAEDWGCPNYTHGGLLAAPAYCGVVVLHADQSAQNAADDPSQPRTTQFLASDNEGKIFNQYNKNFMTLQYKLMSAGHPAKTHAEEVGETFADRWSTDPGGYSQAFGFGPYTLSPGDSIRIVLAEGVAGLDRRTNMLVGRNWFENRAPFILPNGTETGDRNLYKEKWVKSAEDSILSTFRRALQHYANDMVSPQPPAPPASFEVKSGGDRIQLLWANNAESSAHFDGYLIFRAEGQPDTLYDLIFSCDKSNVVNTFNDTTAKRGFDYYYYIQSKDDGTQNDTKSGVPLVSSKFYTMTNKPAFLRRPATESLSEIRVVPNPYHIRASDIQFGKDASDRLAFFGLPPECTIKIYTERGDLIKTLYHTDGSGDELWDSTTESNQIVVSGLYIAYFATPDGEAAFRKFVIIR